MDILIRFIFLASLAFFTTVVAAAESTLCLDGASKLPKNDGYLYINYRGQVLVDRLNGEIRMRRSTEFPIASLTKEMVGFAIKSLIERPGSSISRSTQLKDILPETNSTVTIRDLLQHRSGMPRMWLFEGRKLTSNPSPADAYSGYFKRSDFLYSNLGYGVLAKIVETVSGQTTASYLNNLIFEPAKMAHTRIAHETEKFDALFNNRLMCGPTEEASCVATPGDWYGSADVITTPLDFAKWQIILRDSRFLSQEYLVAMKEKLAHPDQSDDNLVWTEGEGAHVPYVYDYGLNFDLDHSYLRIHHRGDMPSHKSTMVYYPELDLFVFEFKYTDQKLFSLENAGTTPNLISATLFSPDCRKK